MSAGLHEHKPSHLAPAEDKARIVEENRRQEAKRSAEQAEKAAKAEAALKSSAQQNSEPDAQSPNIAPAETLQRSNSAITLPQVAHQTSSSFPCKLLYLSNQNVY